MEAEYIRIYYCVETNEIWLLPFRLYILIEDFTFAAELVLNDSYGLEYIGDL